MIQVVRRAIFQKEVDDLSVSHRGSEHDVSDQAVSSSAAVCGGLLTLKMLSIGIGAATKQRLGKWPVAGFNRVDEALFPAGQEQRGHFLMAMADPAVDGAVSSGQPLLTSAQGPTGASQWTHRPRPPPPAAPYFQRRPGNRCQLLARRGNQPSTTNRLGQPESGTWGGQRTTRSRSRRWIPSLSRARWASDVAHRATASGGPRLAPAAARSFIGWVSGGRCCQPGTWREDPPLTAFATAQVMAVQRMLSCTSRFSSTHQRLNRLGPTAVNGEHKALSRPSRSAYQRQRRVRARQEERCVYRRSRPPRTHPYPP